MYEEDPKGEYIEVKKAMDAVQDWRKNLHPRKTKDTNVLQGIYTKTMHR